MTVDEQADDRAAGASDWAHLNNDTWPPTIAAEHCATHGDWWPTHILDVDCPGCLHADDLAREARHAARDDTYTWSHTQTHPY